MNKHIYDHFQLCGAALCLEERTGQTIAEGEIFYHSNRRRERVEFTPELREATQNAIQGASVDLDNSIPDTIDTNNQTLPAKWINLFCAGSHIVECCYSYYHTILSLATQTKEINQFFKPGFMLMC